VQAQSQAAEDKLAKEEALSLQRAATTDADSLRLKLAGVHVCCSVLQCVAVCCSVLQCVAVFCAVADADTGWCRVIGCLIFIGHFWQKSPIISGYFAENDVQLKASYGSSTPCTMPLKLAGVHMCCNMLQCVAVT